MEASLYPNDGGEENLSTYICEECGERFYSLNDYIAHCKQLHPNSIGTAIT